MKRGALLIGTAMAAMAMATPVDAQTIVMRRPLSVPTAGAQWKATDFTILDTSGNPVQRNAACGSYALQRDVYCVRNGAKVGDAYCRDAGEKPVNTGSAFYDDACSYTWDIAAWQDPGAQCTNSETQTRTVQCRRDLDGIAVDASKCSVPVPESSKTEPDYSTCSYSWDAGAWQDPGAACTASETQTRTVQCKRDLDGTVVADGQCNAANKPSATQTQPDYSTCTHSWRTDAAWTDPGASCTPLETQTRAVWCARDLDSARVSDTSCSAATRPGASQQVTDYSGCNYSAANWSLWETASKCAANTTETRVAQCLRSDGAIVADAECTNRNIALVETRGTSDYSSCTKSWATGAWNEGGSSCTASEAQTRAVWCKRDLDGAVLGDGACNAAVRPGATQSVADYSGCGYSAVNWSAWTYGSTCSASTSRTQTAQCRRSDGTIVADSECASRGVSLTNTENGVSNYTTCTNSWTTGAWNDPGASCTASEAQTRAVWCRRDLDGVAMPDASCAGAKPSASQGVADYSGCSYTPTYTGPAGQTTCTNGSNTLTMTSCLRSDGTAVATSYCTDAGHPATKPQGTADYSTCSHSWATGSWVDPGASCSASETQTRAVWCRRDYDGAIMQDSYCNSGTRPGSTTTVEDYSGCSYGADSWRVSSAGSTCSASSTTTQTAQCRRSDGTVVANSECTSRGISLTSTTTTADYTGCNYSAVNWTVSGWSSTCSNSATKTETAQCQRSDGTMVAASECTSRSVALTRTSIEANTSSCTYSPTYGAWGTCTNGNQTRDITACTRSDGTTVATSYCTNSGSAATQSQSCQSQTYGRYCVGGTFAGSFTYSSTTNSTTMCRAQGANCIEQNLYIDERAGNTRGSIKCYRNATGVTGEAYDSRNESESNEGDWYLEDASMIPPR